MEVRVRAYRPGTDDNYIYATWTRSEWYILPKDERVKKKQWFTNKSQDIKLIIHDPDTHISVACLSSDPNIIIGYIVFMRGLRERICIKKDYRDIGVELLLDLSDKGKNNDRKED